MEELYNEYKIRANIEWAITYIEENVSKISQRVPAYVAFSKRLLKEKNYKHTNNLLGEGLKKYSESGALMMEMGKLKYVTQIYSEAADSFIAALKTKDANRQETLYNLALTNLQMGKEEEAVANLKEVISMNSTYVNAIATLGLAYKRLGKKNEALETYKKALKLSPNDSDIINNIGTILYEQGEYEKAALHFLDALQVKHDDVEVLSNLGNALVKVQKYQQAWVAFDEALKMSPANPKLLENYLLCLLDGREFDKFGDMLRKIKFLSIDTKNKLQAVADEYRAVADSDADKTVRRSSIGAKSPENKAIRALLRKKLKGKSKFNKGKNVDLAVKENN